MEAVISAIALGRVGQDRPKTLAEWNAEYDALSIAGDWWFRAGVAISAWIGSATAATRRRMDRDAPGSPAPRAVTA